MPFHAQCNYCGQKARVPDHMLGASGQCPKCSSFFTLVPVDEGAAAGGGGLPKSFSALPAFSAKTVPAAEQTAPLEPGSGLNLPAKKPSRPAPLELPPDAGERPKLPWIEPIGACALALGGAALLCALTYSLSVVVIPLSLAALLLGLLGLLRVLTEGKFRLEFPVAAPVVAGAVLLTALFFPGLLGPTYLASRAKSVVDTTTVRVVPLSGVGGAAKEDPDWVDASRASLQQGRIRVQVIGVTIKPAKAKSPPKKKEPPEELFYVRLRVRQPVEADKLPEKWSQDEKPRLTDHNGTAYPQRSTWEVLPESGRQAFPTGLMDQVFVFEAPSSPPEYLRFELPAKCWGSTGMFRFTIPGAMIQREKAGSAAPDKLPGTR